MKKTYLNYETPEVKIVTAYVEQGYAASDINIGDGSIDDEGEKEGF